MSYPKLNLKLVKAENGIYYSTKIDANLPQTLKIEGNLHYRFCDFMYIPTRTELLSPEQVKTVSNIRDNYLQDHNEFEINDAIRERFKRLVEIWNPKSLLEIGSGKNPLLKCEELGVKDVFLVDLRQEVVDYFKDDKVSCCIFDDGFPLQNSNESVDCIIAIFVFHFKISVIQIEELYRVLHPEGIIIANVYKRSAQNKNGLLKVFASQGFKYKIIDDNHNLCKDHEYWFIYKTLDPAKLAKIKGRLSEQSSDF